MIDSAEEYYRETAALFPVCTASDEFYFFPQHLPPHRDWSRWDDFTEQAVEAFRLRLLRWEESASGESVDASLFRHSCRTLRGQLSAAGPHRTQPTFHLTVAAAGLAAALESGADAWNQRAAGLPAFLKRAEGCLEEVPVLFLELGLEMVEDLLRWLRALHGPGRETAPAEEALKRFASFLKTRPTREDFLLPEEFRDRVLREHFGCQEGFEGMAREIEDEISEMAGLLRREAETLAPGRSWLEASRLVPRHHAPGGSVLELYRREVARLAAHCLALGIAPTSRDSVSLSVDPLPASLQTVRASDSYNARPGHPPRGGTFYVYDRPPEPGVAPGRSLEYRMTAAHETWPGHHLLDRERWGLANPLRRALERPLFYEGWACFGEELVRRTGGFRDRWDLFVLAYRRYKRAVRGRVDLGLQSGRMRVDDAAAELIRAGFDGSAARSSARTYALRPGYQVCYTVGLRRFLVLFGDRNADDAAAFCRIVLAGGETSFGDLEKRLQRSSPQRACRAARIEE